MDYIYSKLNNTLVDINRIDEITLNKCEQKGVPLESLNVGDYYLKITIVDSNKISYCDLSDLTNDNKNLIEKLNKEIADRILAVKTEEERTNNMINQLNQNVHSQLTQLNKILVDSINTINGGIEEEREVREEADTTLQANLDKESQRVDNMINQVNENIKIIVGQLNQNIASIVLTINTNLDNESKERLKQDNILNERITDEITNLSTTTSEQLTNLTNTVNQNKEDINNRVDEEVSNINNTINTTKQELQTNIDAVDKDLQDKYEYAMDSVSESFDAVRQTIIEETTRATQAENTLQSNIDTETQERQEAISTLTERITTEEVRAAAEEANLDKEIKAEASERIQADNTLSSNLSNEIKRATDAENTLSTNLTNLQSVVSNNFTTLSNAIEQEEQVRSEADNDLSRRIDNLEGKTTRLYYGEGTLTSPTATEIQAFINNLEVEPPYTAPYSGIAVVVYLTDEKTYHIWHYYTNLNGWKDDGIDTVSTFTNDTKGIIQGTTSVGYISAENGFGKVNGWDQLNTTVDTNYSTLNTKIDTLDDKVNEEIANRKGAITNLDTELTADINAEKTAREQADNTLTTNLNKEISDRQTADTNLTNKITNEINRATGRENEIESNLNTFINTTAPNTYIKGADLANQQILLGSGGRNIKTSDKGIEEEQLSSSQSYVPTSQAVHNYVDPLFNNKVDKTTISNIVYATTNTGSQTSIEYSTTSAVNTIVQRKEDGTIEAANPAGNYDVTNLNYVRGELSKKVSDITVSGNAEFVYSKNTNGNNTGILTSSNDGSDDASSKITKYSTGGSLLVNLSDNLSEENKQRQATPKSYVDEIKTTISSHINNTENPHSVTKEQVGLGNVDNTSDLNKPVSTATQTELNKKQDVLVSGTNIKTINNQSILGQGNIEISGSSQNEFLYDDLGVLE